MVNVKMEHPQTLVRNEGVKIGNYPISYGNNTFLLNKIKARCETGQFSAKRSTQCATAVALFQISF